MDWYSIYANIVRARHSMFFAPETSSSFLSKFIAWLNLDLGVEICFYNGLDAYAKTWLQFLFPIYIWLLVLISSHYSTRVSRLSGNNAVQVLATLFLLSYTKVLRIIISWPFLLSVGVVIWWECGLSQRKAPCVVYLYAADVSSIICTVHIFSRYDSVVT